MVAEIKIENLPEEMGEETALANRDDGTLCSKAIGSADGMRALKAFEEKNEDAVDDTQAEETQEDENETEEREFDKNPTVLYALVQKKLWKEAMVRATSHPREARAFICRREKDGCIRWRLLPLHAAVVFKAPAEVVETILSVFPKGSEQKDDQGMLPLHLAFRNSASEEIVNLLLLVFPQSVDSPDRKGRVPLTLAKSAASPHREIYIKALEKGPSHYAVTALACAKDRIQAEQKEIFESKLAQARQFHEFALAEMEENAEKMQEALNEKIAEKENELTKIHENSQVLVDHVSSLEAQMNTRSDTERFLATKIAKLEGTIKQLEDEKVENEASWNIDIAAKAGELEKATKLMEEKELGFEKEKNEFNIEKEDIISKLHEAEKKLASTQEELAEKQKTFEKQSRDWLNKERHIAAKVNQIEIEWASAQANCAILDSQLKKRMENESLLASQVNTLTQRLTDSADNAMKFTKFIKELEAEKLNHQHTVQSLTTRLEKVTGVMEDTRKHQMTILDDAIVQEEMMAKSMETHAGMVSEALTHEKELLETKAQLLTIVEQSFTVLNEKRIERLSTASAQGQYLTNMNSCRQNMLSSVKAVTSSVMSVLTTELNLESVGTEVDHMISEETEDEVVEAEVETEDTVELVVSPKKTLVSVVPDDVATDEDEEGRTDTNETRPEENTNDARVTAE